MSYRGCGHFLGPLDHIAQDPSVLVRTQSAKRALDASLIIIREIGVELSHYAPYDLLHFFSDTRRVRRALLPLDTLALKAEQLSSSDPLAHATAPGTSGALSQSKINSLEQAIDHASVDSPYIQTGDEDLASIEVALNKLLRQMQEAKLQQMRFVNDASHKLRTPHCGYSRVCRYA